MNCSHCRDVVLDIGRGLAHADQEAALDHAQACEACGRYLQQQRELTAGLRALAAAAEDEGPASDLEQRFLAAVAAAGETTGPVAAADETRWSARTARFVQKRWLPIAAALLIAAGVFGASHWRAPNGQPPRSANAHGEAVVPVSPHTPDAPADRDAVSATSPDATPQTRTGRPQPTRAAWRPRVPQARPRIVQAAGFVPLPAAAMLPPFERGEIVRVRIQIASLANLGFTVQPDAADTTPINADLLVGQDGQPRAIRLVTTNTQESRSRR
jgi:hypothetical protein